MCRPVYACVWVCVYLVSCLCFGVASLLGSGFTLKMCTVLLHYSPLQQPSRAAIPIARAGSSPEHCAIFSRRQYTFKHILHWWRSPPLLSLSTHHLSSRLRAWQGGSFCPTITPQNSTARWSDSTAHQYDRFQIPLRNMDAAIELSECSKEWWLALLTSNGLSTVDVVMLMTDETRCFFCFIWTWLYRHSCCHR